MSVIKSVTSQLFVLRALFCNEDLHIFYLVVRLTEIKLKRL
jgi:hypothetical protein